SLSPTNVGGSGSSHQVADALQAGATESPPPTRPGACADGRPWRHSPSQRLLSLSIAPARHDARSLLRIGGCRRRVRPSLARTRPHPVQATTAHLQLGTQRRRQELRQTLVANRERRLAEWPLTHLRRTSGR